MFPLINYDVYRCDRTKNTSDEESGGGVLIGVRKYLKVELIKSNVTNSFW